MALYRLHLKTNADEHGGSREDLVKYCKENSFLAIGWSYLYLNHSIKNTEELLEIAVKEIGQVPRTLRAFSRIKVDDLIWTRDLNGVYYLCRVLQEPESFNNYALDIGCIVKVKMYEIGTSVPGTIVSRFSQPRSGTLQAVIDSSMEVYAKKLYNERANENYYIIEENVDYDLCNLLPALDLEELVIDYLQIKYNYYLSKNSVAKLDTTIKVECELFSRDPKNPTAAVVQVKNGNASVSLEEYVPYVEAGKKVFLFFANQKYNHKISGIECISKLELYNFAKDYYEILPPSISCWVKLCGLNKE